MPKQRELDLRSVGKQILQFGEQLRVDETEAYVVSNRVLTVRLVNNSVFEAKGVHDVGVGVRVIGKSGLGFSSTADLSQESLKKTVQAAMNASKVRKLPFKYSFPKQTRSPNVSGIYDPKLAKLPADKTVELAYAMIEESLGKGSKVVDNAGVLNTVEYHTMIMNSNGLVSKDKGTFFEASLTATAKEGSRSSEGSQATAGRSLKELKPRDVGAKAAEMAIGGLKAKPIKEGIYELVFDPEPTVNITAYISFLVSPMIARLYYPLFLDKLGKQVGSKELTVVDDPLMPKGIGSAPTDEEGSPSRKVIIMNKGTLKNFVYDSFYSAMEKKRATSSGVRTSMAAGVSSFPGKNYNGEPVPIPRNPYIAPGKWKREEIIEDTRDGLLAQRFHYTRITNPVRGDFTSVLRMGLYRVEKGEIIGAVQKSRIFDNLLEVLKKVNAVSDTLVIAGSWGGYSHTPVIRTSAHVTSV